MEELPNSSTLENQENSQIEPHDPQYEDSNDANIDNHKQDNAKEGNTVEIEDDDDEDMDDSINQDNDDNEDDEEEYLESHEHDKNGNSSNPGSPKIGKRITSGASSGEQLGSNISSRSNRRKNKRKNFKPRNILYGGNDEDMEEDAKENAKEKKERKKEFAENKEKAFSIGDDPFSYSSGDLSGLPNTLLFFSTASSGCLLRPACDAGLFGHSAEDHLHGPGDVNIVIKEFLKMGGIKEYYPKKHRQVLPLKCNASPLNFATTVHPAPPQSHCVFVIVYSFIKKDI